MTVEELRTALTGLSETEFRKFSVSWGGGHESVDAVVQAFVHADNPAFYERTIIFRLGQIGVGQLNTEEEKLVAASVASAAAAKVSADAADSSARSAAESVRWARWSALVAAIAGAGAVIAAVLYG